MAQGTSPTQFDSNGNPYFIDRASGARIALPRSAPAGGGPSGGTAGIISGINNSIIDQGNAVADAEGDAASTEFQINENRAGSQRVASFAANMANRRRSIGGAAVTGADKGLSIGALSGSSTVKADAARLKTVTATLGRAKNAASSTDTLLDRLSKIRSMGGGTGLTSLIGGTPGATPVKSRTPQVARLQ